MPEPSQPAIALYVSSVSGKLVARHGASSAGLQVYIGAERTPGKPDEVIWHTEEIIPIPLAEYERFRREYDRHLNATPPNLKRHDKAAYDAYLAQLAAREAAAAAKATPTETTEPPKE